MSDFDGELVINCGNGINAWLTMDEIQKFKLIFPDLIDILKIQNSKSLKFVEENQIIDLNK